MATCRFRRARTFTAALAVAMTCAVTSPPFAAAQTRTWDLQGQVGIGIPSGDLGDTHDPGVAFGLGLSRWISPRLALHVGGAIEQLGGTNDLIEDLTMYHFNGGLELALVDPTTSTFGVYANAGLGGTSTQADNLDNQTDFTINGGLNLEYNVSESLNLMLGPSVYLVMADDTQIVLPILAGFRYLFSE